MTPQEFTELQQQLWSAFGPLISYWLAFLMAGLVAVASLLFGLVYYSDWLNGG